MDIVLNNNKIFINENESSFSLDILSSSSSQKMSDNTFLLNLKKNTECFVNLNDDILELSFDKKVPYLQFVSIKIDYDIILSESQNSLEFGVEDENFIVVFENMTYSFESQDVLLLVLNNSESKLKIYNLNSTSFQNDFVQKSFVELTVSDPFIIDETSKMPEFSIGTYDDSAFEFPRPVRQGNPVISTVPSLIGDNSSDDDIEYFDSGNGPDSKTIYFKIICNTIMESSLVAGDISSNLQLKVYLPNGLDTVKAPIYEDMVFVSKDITNNISIYSSSFTFYKQVRYNNIDYVDGFMYFDVHCPLTVQQSIPLQFDFSL